MFYVVHALLQPNRKLNEKRNSIYLINDESRKGNLGNFSPTVIKDLKRPSAICLVERLLCTT